MSKAITKCLSENILIMTAVGAPEIGRAPCRLRRAGSWHNALLRGSGPKRVMPDRNHTPKTACRRPNSDVLARERELPSRIDLFSSDADVDKLITEIKGWASYYDYPLELVCIDTFNAASPGADENQRIARSLMCVSAV